MEDLKTIFTGPAGRFALGITIGAMIARIVDARPLGDIIGLGLILGFTALVVHGLISKS
jgi:F0F1-type ATP synthase assembly protein I